LQYVCCVNLYITNVGFGYIRHNVLQCIAVCYSVLQYVTVCYSMSQCVAVCCNMYAL